MCIILWHVFILLNFVKGQTNTATLIVPVSGKCGENTELTCQHTAQSCQAWGYRKGSVVIYSQVTDDSTKYTGTSRKLTIMNTELSDADNYICYCDSASQVGAELKYECKPKDVTQQVTSAKKLSISVNPVYPEPTQMSVTLNNPLSGNYNCISSPTLSSHFSCTWTSSSSLEDVDGGYRVVVTTVTQTALTGNIKIVTPGPPSITNREQLPDGRSVIRVTRDSQVTLECVSSGGIPAPTVAWYRDSIRTPPLSNTSTGVQQGDGTYRLTLTHTITASRSEDLNTFVCRSYYPQATSNVTQGSLETTVLMYLNLRPSQPTINQTNTPVSTGTMTLQCRTSGGRPAPTVTWTYKGQTFSPEVQSDKNVSTETYSVVSMLQRPVTAADNGEPATCHVNNAALTTERTTNVDVAVKFPVSPSSTVITGNRDIIATGSSPLNLNCTTGSSNPASTITWRRGSTVITSSNPVNSWTGTNRGVVTSQILTLRPTRDDDGEVITCSVTNSDSDVAASQGGAVTDSATLNLKYSPEIQPMTSITVDEGQVGVDLACIVSSKPVSEITWFHGESSLVTGQGTPTGDGYNSLNYTLTTVSRDDQGTYRCRADNQIGSADNKDMVVNVRYVTVTAINTTSTSNKTTVTCTLNNFGGSFDPKPWVQMWQQSKGEYVEVNSRPFSTTLNLTQLTYQHSGLYICMVKAGDSGAIYVQGNISILIQAPPVILEPKVNQTRVAGRLNHNATVPVQYYSNVPGSDVKCYRRNNGVRSSTQVGHTTQSDVEVQLPVFNQIIPTLGTLVTVTIMINREEDFEDYDIVITNGIGSGSTLLISIVQQGPPDAPKSVKIVTFGSDIVTLEWVPGYHGGLDQTVVMQLSQDRVIWFNKTEVNIGQDQETTITTTLNGLAASTLNYVRLFAYNSEGQSENYSAVLNFTTYAAPDGSSSAALIGGAAGGAAGVIVIAVVVAILIIRRRKQSKADSTELMDRRRESDSDDYVTENAQYASADQVESPASGSATYAVVDKKKKKGPDPSALYAVPDKPKKGPKPDALYATPDKKKKNNAPDPNALYAMPEKKKGGTPKGKKPKAKAPAPDGDVYENAPEFAVKNKKKGKGASKDESVYEDTTVPPLMPKPKPKKNKDGLVYADLTFSKTANGKDGKIHGLENATTYMEVDFTKKAKPLPESDEE